MALPHDTRAERVVEPPPREGFGTFAGVWLPVFLTILGAMVYLREGWLVANAGLGGALLVIAAAYLVTGTTALSLSSIATNNRVRAGGAFAIISAALGLEAGGAIGIPLYIAQTVSSVMYLYGFSEGWLYLFPSHRPGVVVAVAFVATGAVVSRSAAFAARAQSAMFLVVLAALASAFGGWATAVPHAPAVIGDFSQGSLLTCFALFFPAATGIMVGVGMSGSLRDPRRSVPRGTLGAWATTLALYVTAAIWYGTVASREELLADKLAMVNHAVLGPMVLFGLLSSTLMAALSSLLAAPRLLAAMAELRVVPFADRLAATTPSGEPRNATLVTLGIASLGLLAGSLDAIAPIITSFFIMTYLAVNLVVLVEQSLAMVSWRPTFQIPTWVPALGTVACLVGLVVSSPAGGLPEVTFVAGLWLWLARRRTETPWETVQSGIAQDVAAWAVLRASELKRSERSWKPDLLVPVHSLDELAVLDPLVEALTEVRGSARWVALRSDPTLARRTEEAVERLRGRQILCSSHVMPEESPGQGLRLSIAATKGTLFAPNLVLLSARHEDPELLRAGLAHATSERLGALLAFDDPARPFGPCDAVTVWLSDRAPHWELGLHAANLDLPVLVAWLLTRRKRGHIRLAMVLRDFEASKDAATAFLQDVVELGRLADTSVHVLGGSIEERLADAPTTDVHVLGLPPAVDLERLSALRRAARGPCLFARDSGHESALA